MARSSKFLQTQPGLLKQQKNFVGMGGRFNGTSRKLQKVQTIIPGEICCLKRPEMFLPEKGQLFSKVVGVRFGIWMETLLLSNMGIAQHIRLWS